VAQLLNHTSGLGDYFLPANKAKIDAAITATDLLPLALAAPPSFSPGSKRAYSNSGFVVLGAIVEKVSGKNLPGFHTRRDFDPARYDGHELRDGWQRGTDDADVSARHSGQAATIADASTAGITCRRHFEYPRRHSPVPDRAQRWRDLVEQGDTN